MAEQNASGGGEKTHDPTPRKLEEARRRGDVPKSADVAAAAVYLAILVAAVAFGADAASRSGEVLAGLLGGADRLEGRIAGPGGGEMLGAIARQALMPLAPFVLGPAAAALAAYVAQRAFVPALEKIEPKLSRISPISNAGQKYGMAGMAEFLKAAIKLTAISIVLALVLVAETDRILGLVRIDPRLVGSETLRLGMALMAAVAAVAGVVAAADWLWQQWHHSKRLRMSFQDLRDEAKTSEGDPHLKAERRRRAQGIATNRMLLDVPKSDVIIVNPTHYAVALQWDRARGSAPVCVAKGVDEVALAKRARAAEAGVPVRRDAPAARALHDTVEIGEEIRPEHYRAVAAAIRWAESMRALARERGFQKRPKP
ncbi:MAG: flagellar type III secretion system protein FlhB [Pseudomonadota bacterium]